MVKMIIENKNSAFILAIILALTGIFFGSSYPLDIYGITNKDLSLAQLFELVEDSVVQITRTVPGTDPYAINDENSTTLGSGFLYNDKGYIITNNHVVESAKTVDVSFINGDRYTANITGTDAFSDLALIKINENFTKLPKPLAIGNSTALKVGEQVVAIGNPFGLEGSMTTGIVSQVGRLLSVDGQGFSIPNAIQTDASINPGNSGGPLLNMKGEVIGVNTAGIFPGGIGLAVSSDTVQRIIPILMETGNYTHPWLGITGTTLTSELAKREKIDNSQKDRKSVV